jgi:hypothetical protein
MSEYVSDVAEIGRAVNGDKKAPIVLYAMARSAERARTSPTSS